MLAFAEQFGRHSLLLTIVCGMIADYRRRPYDFDAWRADPIYGGGLKLTEVDLKQRYTHILHFALAGLDELTRKLLCRIAVISENANYDTLAVLNPFLPPKPAEVEEPSDPFQSYSWRRLERQEKDAATTEQREQVAAEKAKYRAEDEPRYREAQQAYLRYQEAMRLYPTTPEYYRAVTAFDSALKELEERGLLQWDRDANTYGMHPVVRGHAAELLEAGDRTETFHKVRDHFASLPPDDLYAATELVHVAHSLEIYRCFVEAGMLDEAVQFYRGELSYTLLHNVGAYAVVLELLKPLFLNDLRGMPCLTSASDRSYILNDLAIVYMDLGRSEDAVSVLGKKLQLDLEAESRIGLDAGLYNLSVDLHEIGRRAEGAAALALCRELAEAYEDENGVTMAIFLQMADAIEQGRFADAETLDAEFRKRPLPHVAHYRPGEVDFWRCRSQFFQGTLTEAEWQAGHDVALRHRNVSSQHQFLALRAESDLLENRPERALEAIDQALQITNKLGTPKPEFHGLRAWALARVGRTADARAELHEGIQRILAAEAYCLLGDCDQARECALNGYRRAWGEGPPYIHWYDLERSRALLHQLGEPEPQLPPFDPSKVPPIPFEKEIRAAIERLQAERDKERERDQGSA